VALRPNDPATLIETLLGGNRQKVVIVHRFFGPVRLPANCRSNNSAALSPALRSFSLRAGQRATALTSLIHCAQLNGHDPYVYLKDVLTRLLTHRADHIAQFLPHHWRPLPA
jgi:hypothetical protein